MINCVRTANSIFTLNSYSSAVLGVGCSALFREKLHRGKVTLRKISQESELRNILSKYNLPEFDSIIPLLPKQLWKRRSDFMVTYGFTIHSGTAGEIAATVMDSVSRKTKEPVVIELNPGIGLITEQLFSMGLKKLVVFDNSCVEPFRKIIKKYETQIELHQVNAFDAVYNVGEWQVPECYSFLKELLSMEGDEIIIIGMSPNRLVFRRLCEFILNCPSPSFKNIEWFLIVTDTIYKCVIKNKGRQARLSDYGCVNLLFDVELLKKYPRDNFLPLPLPPKDNRDVSLVKLTRKIPSDSKEELLLYKNFLNVIGTRKTNYFIGQMEKWFPGSGPYFIARGVSVTNQVFEFSSEDLFTLFKILRELKGYDDSFNVMKTYEFKDGPPCGIKKWTFLC